MATSPVITITNNTTYPTARLNLTSPALSDGVAVCLRNSHDGLGIKVIGGVTEESSHGIFIKHLIPGGLAQVDGRVEVGDRLVRVNGRSLENTSYSNALELLREAAASGQATLIIERNEKTSEEFTELMEDELSSASEESHVTTPLNNMPSTAKSSPPASPIRGWSEVNGQMMNNATGHADSNLLNNSLTRSECSRVSHNGGESRPDIEKLENLISQQLHGNTGMASTPYGAQPNSQKRQHRVPAAHCLLPPDQPPFTRQSASTSQSHQIAAHNFPKLSLNANVRLDMSKLETALRFLGVHPTESQRVELRGRLNMDTRGSVSYGEFVHVAKEIFHEELQNRDISVTLPEPESVLQNLTRFAIRPTKSPEVDLLSDDESISIVSFNSSFSYSKPTFLKDQSRRHHTVDDESSVAQEIRQLQKENASLRKQVHCLNRQLSEQVMLTAKREKEVLSFRKGAQTSLEENNLLKEKVLMANEAQKMAEKVETEFEQIIGGLEKELTDLREKEAKQMESPLVRKKLAVLGTQLRKSENSRLLYHVATQKLLDFVEHVHTVMSGSAPRNVNQSQPTPKRLADESTHVMVTVRDILSKEALPFGWEECYTADGIKYFTNHITEETTWQHPVTHQAGGQSTSHRLH